MRNRLGIAIGQRTYRAYRELLVVDARWQRLAAAGARPQTPALGQHRHEGSAGADSLYVEALTAPDTINTMPEKTLRAFADHGRSGA